MENLNNCDLNILYGYSYNLSSILCNNKIFINDIILTESSTLTHQLPRTNSLPLKGKTWSTQLCRLVQYFSKYLGSVYSELNEKEPHLRNELVSKIKKTDTMWGSMAMARKVLRFGPSISCVRTFILNTL